MGTQKQLDFSSLGSVLNMAQHHQEQQQQGGAPQFYGLSATPQFLHNSLHAHAQAQHQVQHHAHPQFVQQTGQVVQDPTTGQLIMVNNITNIQNINNAVNVHPSNPSSNPAINPYGNNLSGMQ